MKKIPLYLSGKIADYALVNDEDFERLNVFHWHYVTDRSHNTAYAVFYFYDKEVKNTRRTTMHRFLLNLGKYDGSNSVDHINHNGIDNRKENLRVCSLRDNLKNSQKPKNNSTGYKGVIKTSGGLRTCLSSNGTAYRVTVKDVFLGAILYDVFAIIFHKEFACLNLNHSPEFIQHVKSLEQKLHRLIKQSTKWARGGVIVRLVNFKSLYSLLFPSSKYEWRWELYTTGDLSEAFGLTRERIRQIRSMGNKTNRLIEFEDYIKVGGRYFYKPSTLQKIRERGIGF